MGDNENPNASVFSGIYAFDRGKMLAGQPATFQRFEAPTNVHLPSDLHGSNLPPAGAPNYFYTMMSDGAGSRLELREFKVDFATPANSTFGNVLTISVAPFYQGGVCGSYVANCIPQQGTTRTIEAGSDLPLPGFHYRNFGSHEALVGSFIVGVGGTPGARQGAIRWFELRKIGSGAWTLYQEGTFAPDTTTHRIWSSIAMDRAGNIAIGYTASSSSMYPAQRYVTRSASDPLGQLQDEVTLMAGTASQTWSNQWEDYTSMSVDPSDDCTFWYTGEYILNSAASWRTRIGTFKMPNCAPYKLFLPLLLR
jgi:hypothetical protein